MFVVCLISVLFLFFVFLAQLAEEQKMRLGCCFSCHLCAIPVVTLFDGVVAVAVGVVGHVSQQGVVRVRVLGAQAVRVCRRVRAASPGELAWKHNAMASISPSKTSIHVWLRTHDGGLPATAVQSAPIVTQAGEASEREGAAGWRDIQMVLVEQEGHPHPPLSFFPRVVEGDGAFPLTVLAPVLKLETFTSFPHQS